MGRRLAVLVGCNYTGTNQALPWPINNVGLWKQQLLRRFGFKEQDITVMTDDGKGVIPTRDKILAALDNMVKAEEAKAGDVFFFHFSGQGTLLPSGDPAIVAYEDQHVTDTDFRNLVNCIPTYASFIILADCNHSGGLIYGEKPQIAPEPPVPYQPDAGILLSACQKNENPYKHDKSANTTYGAFTNAVKTVLQGNRNAITNKELVLGVRDELQRSGIAGQHPCLYCSNDNANAPFLQQPTTP